MVVIIDWFYQRLLLLTYILLTSLSQSCLQEFRHPWLLHRCMGDLTIIKNPHYNVAVRCYWPWRKTHSHYHQRLQVFFLKHNFIISAKIWINSIFTSVSYILSHVKSGFRNYSVALDCCVREMGIRIMLLPYGLVLTIYSEIYLVYIKIQYSSDVSISHEKCHLVHKGILFTQVASPCPLFTWVHGLF